MKALIYCRVSTAEQAVSGLGLGDQEQRGRSWCEAMGFDVAEVVTDAGISGSRPLADRPGARRIVALLDARKPDVDTVVVLNLSRLGRDAAETLAVMKRFRHSSVGLVAIAERLDLGTPTGRAMAGMKAVFDELELDLIRQRTADALGELRRTGRPWNHPPFGWQVTGGRLTPDHAEQVTLARILDHRTRGVSYNRIATALNDEHVPTKRGGPWHAASVRSVVLTAEKMATPAGS